MIVLNAPHTRRAFSLVEILIAILVLGFGLLGLAAVFPVVVSQQRDAANEMRGPSAVASIRAQVETPKGMIDWEPVIALAQPPAPTGGPSVGASNQGRWIFDRRVQGGLAGHQRLIDTYDNGAIELRTTPVQLVPVTARVFPAAYGSATPQFAWDIALRRTAHHAPLEVALFVRRIDAGIRVPDDKRLANVLTGEGLRPGGNVTPTAVPLGETPAGGADDERRPSGNGTGDYSRLRELYVFPEHAGGNQNLPVDRFPIPAGSSKLVESLLGREGQLILDDLGIVRRVLGIETDGSGDRQIVVDPPFPNLGQRVLVYTPQTPVSVQVFTVEGE